MGIIDERLRGSCEGLKLMQQKLSKLTGISQTAINRYGHGDTTINAKALLKYADFLMCPLVIFWDAAMTRRARFLAIIRSM